ncbi:MAG: UDP-N-acetylmuramate--L-alanine ligase [Fermentimonas sp.]|nr:UDP-N-acetylmuramate--L-alanine ligase [Fermentimonas sp.]
MKVKSNGYKNIYFIGIGGIGMSNLARYFLLKGANVGGYDRTESELTETLSKEGALVHYEDNLLLLPAEFTDKENTLIVYTPAVPTTHSELNYFKDNDFVIVKRAQLLGEITKQSDAICVAGTHGKTTVSSMVAHLFKQSHIDCNAFLGGILKNYNSNLLLSEKSNFTVVEADEYDRSFHSLQPHIAIITSADPDHLDIYGTEEAYKESFEKFTSLISPNGHLILKIDAHLTPKVNDSVKVWSYSETKGDFHAENIRIGNGEILFDFVSPKSTIKDVSLGVPVKINIENGIAAMAAAELCEATPEEIKEAMGSFMGVKRRFEFHLKNENIIFIDDYAHHPHELKAAIVSIKALYPDKKLTAIFQPHLYSRTRDFANEFAESLSLAEDIILLDIYPAREEPIEGVSSKIIFDKIMSPNKQLIIKSELLDLISKKNPELVVTFGAGDIDRIVPRIKEILSKNN